MPEGQSNRTEVVQTRGAPPQCSVARRLLRARSGRTLPNAPGRPFMILERMTQKRFLAVPAVATLGLVLMLAGVAAAQASHCRKDCQQDIKSCLALVPPNKECTGTKAEKKGCRKTHAAQRKHCRSLTKLCEQQNPSMSGTCVLT